MALLPLPNTLNKITVHTASHFLNSISALKDQLLTLFLYFIYFPDVSYECDLIDDRKSSLHVYSHFPPTFRAFKIEMHIVF